MKVEGTPFANNCLRFADSSRSVHITPKNLLQLKRSQLYVVFNNFLPACYSIAKVVMLCSQRLYFRQMQLAVECSYTDEVTNEHKQEMILFYNAFV